MQLNKLEIKGFKSFGDKVIINFDEGITGIVGPNGCGKSNVVDAIRWVLGEQKTKALRSEKMENIIFNGTKTRKALQMAEVSLTFNNNRNLLPTEYSQVTVTRKYYRTGESEYMLNNVACRLKDITNLFLDTGIGSDSYAIIELKMVDEILNDKDNSRRGLFEEAAGISKFKIRKRETLRKLEDTDNDLSRVEDLLHEISKNLKTLEKQAKQTQSYFKLKEEYKHWSIALAWKTISKHSDAFISLGKHIETEQNRRSSLQDLLLEKDAQLDKEKNELLEKEKLLSARQKTLNEYINKIRQYESEKKIRSERLNFLSDKVSSLQTEIETDTEQKEKSEESVRRLQLEKQAAEVNFRETEAQVKVLLEEYQEQKELTQDLQREATLLNQTYRSKQDEIFQLKKALEIKQIQLSSLKQELERASSDNAAQSSNLSLFEEKLYEVNTQLEEHQEKYTTLQKQVQTLQQELGQTEVAIETTRQDLAQTNRTLDAKQNEYKLTKSLVDNLEGFPEAIKYLKKHHGFDKSAPLLSDIVTCSSDYRIAIENYLEPVMNYYVVQTEEQAYQAIGWLSHAEKGRAHFFVLDNVKGYQSPKPALADPAKGIVAAIDIVDYEEKYKPLISILLEGVYILSQSHSSIPGNDGAIFITQNGKITRRRFSISGGSVGSFEGKRIGRARNLESLKTEIAELSEKLTQYTAAQQKLQQRKGDLLSKAGELNNQISRLQKEINTLSQEQISIKTRQEQTALLLSNQTMRHSAILEQMEVLQEEITEQEPEAEKWGKELKAMESKINTLNQDLLTQNEMLGLRSSAYNQETIRFHQQQNKVAGIIQEITHKASILQSSHLRLEKNQEELTKAQMALEELIGSGERNDDELVAMYKEKENIETGVNEAEKNYYQARGTIDKLEKESKEVQRQRETTDSLISELHHRLNETKLQLTSVKERLSVEFSIDLDTFIEEKQTAAGKIIMEGVPEDITEPAIKEKVQEIKSKMDRIGPINPLALEAFEEMKSRYDFINSQKQDLVNAKQSLLDTIQEISMVAKDNFMKAYEQIRQNFIKVFRSLFSEEDTCDLKLSNPDNPLESSIEILAKPKGKRPLTINQLSGGEKTLTAISLLFAIYLLKPAPFCIFDEVDAPLDDANIDKFNNIIRKFSNESQFIIVTHNKRTMVSTDIIYGITQTEGDIGVSKVVPVDLRALV
ncbi:chromosome segregation protein SMC [Rhodocytophaga aerolata]|uniref:Chromosome partition protein Smc n=1 Tax=Rhodocytophaga aerolata TaxID=455078 RepID=A0ABT8R8F0_9BACT|nr:chromosome segregation protein SMC [Rhodocytophaga aerolata]MDO1447478.1 chromosome segregation protein SMC [Rhodocytophaga aerolata]